MIVEKKALTSADIEEQTALELPNRETLCGPIVVLADFISILDGSHNYITVNVEDNNVATQVCGNIGNVTVVGFVLSSCKIFQN